MSRYARQHKLAQMGEEGQKAISGSHVLVIGCGALGSSAADALVRAGVGRITIVDADRVEEGNLHRTALFDGEDIGEYKAVALRNKLLKINSTADIKAEIRRADVLNIEDFMDADIVVDGTDNLESRFLINDACVKHGVPWVYAGVLGTGGNVMLILPQGPCLRCLIPELPEPGTYPVCEETGVYGIIPQIIGRLAASEAMRYLVERPANDSKSPLLLMELWPPSMEEIRVQKRNDCPTCSLGRFDFLEGSE